MFERHSFRDLPKSAKALGAIALTIFAVDAGVRVNTDLNKYPNVPVTGSVLSATDILNTLDPASWFAAGVTKGIKSLSNEEQGTNKQHSVGAR